MNDRHSRRESAKSPPLSYQFIHAGKRLVRLGERKLGHIFKVKGTPHWRMGRKLLRATWEDDLEYESLESLENHIADLFSEERRRRA